MAKLTKSVIYKGAYGGTTRSGIQTIGYAEIGYKGVKKGKCTECGKLRQVTRDFTQTANPFNKAMNGEPKSEDLIKRQELVKLKAWEAEPHVCNNCADRKRSMENLARAVAHE